MITMNVNIDGLKELLPKFSKLPEVVAKATEDAAITIRNLVIGRTPVDTGALKSSWSAVKRTSGGFSFENDKEYAVIVEEGRYTGLGPRTVRQQGGIYSRQAPGGMLAPILADEDLLNRMANKIAEQIVKGLKDV